MANLKVVIDGKVIMDGSPGEWETNPSMQPDELNVHKAREPYSRPLLVALAEVAMQQRSATFVVTTRDGGWTLEVDG